MSVREFRQRVLPFAVFGVVLVATVLLWNRHQGRSSIVGQAEAVRAVVTATKPGSISELKVDLLQPVKRGDVVARLLPADVEAVTATLAADVEKLRAELLQTSERNIVNYQNLRLDWLRRNVDLASARVELQLAESDYQRYAALHANHTVSDAEFELKRTNRDALQTKVGSLEQLSAELEVEIAHLKPNSLEASPVDRAVAAATVAQQKQLQALADAAVLRAPMDGIITAIQKRTGENAAPGDLVLTIGALKPTRIIAYVRQPLDTQLKIGDLVDVTTRTASRATARARVLQVGTQLEAIEPALLPPSMTSSRVVEYGLPVLVEIPAALNLAPGEVVSVSPRSAE